MVRTEGVRLLKKICYESEIRVEREEMVSKEKNAFMALLQKGDAEIRDLKREVSRLTIENLDLKTDGTKRLESEKTILMNKIEMLEAQCGRGESEAIIKMRREVDLYKEANARLMLKVDELNKTLQKK